VLIIILFLIGVFFEFLLGLTTEKVFPNFKYKTKRKTSIGFGLLVGGIIFFFPAFGLYYNKTFYTNSNCNKYVIASKVIHYNYRTVKRYYIQINNNGSPLEIEIDEFDFERISNHAKVEVCIAKGGLGFDLVTHVYYE
ncbi:MAG: hypothetical protein ACHQII_05600, partial [Bacteroidia bacterium]